jgi:hypothetical protein
MEVGMDKILRVKIPEDALVRSLQEPKDFRIVVHSDGTFTATCKACQVAINTAEKNGLVWYVCPGCKRSSFQPVGNVKRDIGFAEQAGGVFECELFFLRELPKGLEPPEECLA